MDAYLTRGAARTLRALALFPGADGEGFLLGHRRGNRRIVEKALPTERGFFPTLDSFVRAEDILGGTIIGFFSFKPGRASLRKILAPFACGKVFLNTAGLKTGKRAPRAFLIDFDRVFALKPMPCVLEKETRGE
jgi:hypothetical protein